MRLSLSATLSMNLKRPTVVFPAAVVPSRNSTGASHLRNALYFSDNIKSANATTTQLLQHIFQFVEPGFKAAAYLHLFQ